MGTINNPALTVGELQALGRDSVEASCELCGTRWLVPVDFLPTATNLAKIAELLICPTCGGGGVNVAAATPDSAF